MGESAGARIYIEKKEREGERERARERVLQAIQKDGSPLSENPERQKGRGGGSEQPACAVFMVRRSEREERGRKRRGLETAN